MSAHPPPVARRVVYVLSAPTHPFPREARVASIRDTHADWFGRIGWDANAAIHQRTRGFVEPSKVWVYRTHDFTADEDDLFRLSECMECLTDKLIWLRDDARVVAGYDPNDFVARYAGGERYRDVGSVGEFLRHQWRARVRVKLGTLPALWATVLEGPGFPTVGDRLRLRLEDTEEICGALVDDEVPDVDSKHRLLIAARW